MSLLPQFAKLAARGFSASAAVAASAAASGSTPARKVAVLGAAGGIGQPLGLLMKVRNKVERAARA
jgi:malate dehydrogenase